MADDQESRPLKRCNQAIKTLFLRSNGLIPVTSVSTESIEVTTGNPLSYADFQWSPVKQHTNIHKNMCQF